MTQAQRVLQYMEQFGGITQNEATKYIGCTDLAGAVYQLKKNGHVIGGGMDSRTQPLRRPRPLQKVSPY